MLTHLVDLPSAYSGALLAATKAKTSSGSFTLLIFVALFALVYFVFLRPQRKRQQAQLAQRRQVELGDEVVTSAGIYGKIVSFEGDRARVEIGPNMTIEVARRALGQRVDPIDEPPVHEDHGSPHFGEPGYDGHDDLEEEPHPNGTGALASPDTGPTVAGSEGETPEDTGAATSDEPHPGGRP